jgi:hypothetical protein
VTSDVSDGTFAAKALSLLAPSIALTAALLPFLGYVMRWVSFFASGVGYPSNVAVAAPIGLLADTGFNAILLELPLVAGLLLIVPVQRYEATMGQRREAVAAQLGDLERRISALPKENPQQSDMDAVRAIGADVDNLKQTWDEIDRASKNLHDAPRVVRVFGRLFVHTIWGRAFVVLVLALNVAAVLLEPGFPGALLFVVGNVAIFVVTFRLMRGWRPLTFGRTWPFLLGYLGFVAIAAGLTGNITGVIAGDFRFAATAGVRSGAYYELGDSGSFTFLRACGSEGHVLIVPDTAIESVNLNPNRLLPASLYSVLFDHSAIYFGFAPPC